MTVVALVMLVGCSALALSALHGRQASGTASLHEAVSAATLYAADSGAQIAANRLFYPAVATSSANSACDAMNPLNVSFTAAGLNGCSAAITCTRRTAPGGSRSFYEISSQGSCGTGDAQSQRTIDLTSFLDD